MLQYGVRFADGYSVLLLSGQKLFGIDAFGLGVIFFCYFCSVFPTLAISFAARIFPSGPSFRPGSKKPKLYPVPVPIPILVTATQLIPYHCRVFLAGGSLYEGSFVLLAKNAAEAHAFAGALQDQSILVKYNPRHPKTPKWKEKKYWTKTFYRKGTTRQIPASGS